MGSRDEGGVEDGAAVVDFILLLDTAKDGDRLGNGGLVDHD